MALYRNIAGLDNQGQQVGLSILQPTTSTLRFQPISEMDILPGTYNLDRFSQTPEEYAAERERLAQAMADAKAAKYDYLLTTSLSQLTAEGYYVTLDNGSIFKWDDATHYTSRAYLPIQDIQEIENARGNAGTLLLHMQQPALAKDTAGYAGGGSSTWGSTTQYSDPIPEVQDLPPVTESPSGDVKFEYDGPFAIPTVDTPTNTTTTTTPTTTTTTTTTPTTAKSNLAPLVAIGGILAVAIAGDRLAGRRAGLVVVGGVGALFYLMAKRSK